MSNKPLKISDQKKLNGIMRRKRKKIESIHELPPYTVIFSEGTKTEPLYIKGMAKAINNTYAAYGQRDRITVVGTGRNTQGLLRYAQNEVKQKYPDSQIIYLMYDKDDFPPDNFDNTQFSAERMRGKAENKRVKQEYRVAWSNECIELWFVLHFQELESNISRTQYHKILNQHIPYEKNMENLYDLLRDKTKVAIKRARNLMNQYELGAPPSKCAPATRVHELVEFLIEYL
jgi:hypothetical protein